VFSRKTHRAIIIALLSLLSSLHSAADSGSYIFRESAVSKSMLQKTTTALFVSSRGRLWIGTQQGLHAYTGVQTSSYYYDPGNSIGLRSDYISAISEMADGTIIVGTRDKGAYTFDPFKETFSLLGNREKSGQRSESIYAIHADSNDRLWVGLDGEFQVHRKNPQTNAIEEITTFFNDTGAFTGFAETADGIWSLHTAQGVRLHPQPGSEARVTITLESIFGDTSTPPEATGILSDSSGNLWIWSLRHGLVAIDPGNGKVAHRLFTDAPGASTDITVYSMIETAPQQFLVATSRGPYEFDATYNRLTLAGETFFSGGSPTVTSLAIGLNKTVWLGTLYGPVSGTPRLFDSISTLTTALPTDSINAIAETEDGFWLATENGLTHLNNKLEAKQTFNDLSIPRLSDPTVMAVAPDENGVWVGTFSGGLNYLTFDGGKTQVFQSDKSDPTSLGANGVTSILLTKDNNVLVGTYGGGLNVFDREKRTFRRLLPSDKPNSISSERVTAVYQCSLGKIYVGTESGLNIFDESNGTFTKVFANPEQATGLVSDFVWSFFEDSAGDLWIASYRGGISRWERDDRAAGSPTFKHAPSELSNQLNTISAIAEDPEGYIWLAHNGGLTRVSKDYRYFRTFGINDGLLDTEFNVGAALTASDGTVFFAGNRGINVINPDSLPGTDTLPKISISEILVMNERVSAPKDIKTGNRKIELGYNDRLLEVNFFSSYLSDPEDVEYAYFLDGISSEWVTGKERHSASFTTLPAGKYKLQLAAANPSGAWNWNGPSVDIIVAPPPWLSLWAYAGYLSAAILAAVFLVYRLREKDLKQAEARLNLERMVQQRTKELEIASKRADEANKAKSQFLAAMSHEIRTPMHGILGMLELLQTTNLNDDQIRYADNAKKAGNSLLKIINDILDFSKLEASRVEIEHRPFNVNRMLEDVCILQAASMTGKSVMLLHNALPADKSTVVSDEVRLGQCVTNLISNAIKFTDRGRIIVDSKTTTDTDKKVAILEISVSDDGIGMDDETQSTVFQEFTQADASTTRKYGGTGLGLSITKQFVELMGGEISLTSHVGRGTKVTIRIPAKFATTIERRQKIRTHVFILGDDLDLIESIKSHFELIGTTPSVIVDYSPQAHGGEDAFWLAPIGRRNDLLHNVQSDRIISYASTPTENFESDIRFPIESDRLRDLLTSRHPARSTPSEQRGFFGLNLHVLVAEDVPLNQRIAEENLTKIGIETVIVGNGREAFDAFRRSNFDIVFMDCHMPQFDGYAATRQIREYETEHRLKRTPIVALTAGKGSGDERECIQAGMDAILLKPFTVVDLKESIATHIPKAKSFAGRSRAVSILDGTVEQHGQVLPRIDNEVLKNFIGLAPDNAASFISQLAQGFEDQMTKKICDLFDSDGGIAKEELRAELHSMKSMSMNMGAVRLTRLFAELEGQAKATTLSLSLSDKLAAQELLNEYLIALYESIDSYDSSRTSVGTSLQ
jgi:signal transduction histidine kinase/CheY-like chemotaxis protein/ligand-binding sensor domain-containing protein